MTVKWLRLAYVGEFLLALVAIFTAWSEIAGQAPLDLMSWAWKFGLGIALALAIVAYTDALVREEAIWTMRSSRWLAMIVLLVVAMGALTFYYALQDEAGDSDDTSTISMVIRKPEKTEKTEKTGENREKTGTDEVSCRWAFQGLKGECGGKKPVTPGFPR